MIALVLVLQQAAIAHGDLSRVSRYADQVTLVVARERGNLVEPAALRALLRWPALVSLELRLPVAATEARQLRQLGRLAALVPRGRERDPSLKLLAPALVRTRTMPSLTPAPSPCASLQLSRTAAGEEVAVPSAPLDACTLDWLAQRLSLHADPPRDPLKAR